MDKQIRRLRRQLERAPRNGRGYRSLDPEIRKAAAELSVEWRSEGRKQRELAEKLGLSIHTLSNWRASTKPERKQRTKSPRAIRAVKLAAEPAVSPSSALIVRTTSGLCIEGLDLDQVIAIAKELA